MRVEVKLLAYARDYLPMGSDNNTCTLELEEGATVGQVLERLKIPDSMPIITLVNGAPRKLEECLHSGEVITILPPAAGG